MPGYKAHLSFGFVLGFAVLIALFLTKTFEPKPEIMLLLMLLCLIGSLMPDMDTDSKGQNLVYTLLLLIDLFLIFKQEYKWASILGLCAILPALGHHRGWTHSWWAMLLVPAPAIAIPVFVFHYSWQSTLPYYLAFVLGYFSHLLLDQKLFRKIFFPKS